MLFSIIPIITLAQSGFVEPAQKNIDTNNLKNEILLVVQEKLYEQY